MDNFGMETQPNLAYTNIQLLRDKVANFRENNKHKFQAQYYEKLISRFKWYGHLENLDEILIESMLAFSKFLGTCVVSRDIHNELAVYGFVVNNFTISNPQHYFSYRRLTASDILLTLPENLRRKDWNESLEYTSTYTDGNFVVIRNKNVTFQSDEEIVELFSEEYSELMLTRLTLEIQSKMSTAILGEKDDVDLLIAVSNLYDGIPYLAVSQDFDIQERLLKIEGMNLNEKFGGIKSAVEVIKNEADEELGMRTLPLSKESGIGKEEIAKNIEGNATSENVRLKSRKKACMLINECFNADIHVKLIGDDDEQIKKLTDVEEIKDDII